MLCTNTNSVSSLKPPNPDPDGDNEEEPSEYERLRLANIARNASVMVELGLDGHPTSGRHRRGSSSNTSNSSTRPIKRPKPAALPPSVPERRSTRAAGLPAPNYKEVPAFRIRDLEGRSTSGRGKYGSTMDIKVEDCEEEVEEAESSERQLVRVPKLSVQLPPDAASSRAMYCNLEALLGPKQLGRAVRERDWEVDVVWCISKGFRYFAEKEEIIQKKKKPSVLYFTANRYSLKYSILTSLYSPPHMIWQSNSHLAWPFVMEVYAPAVAATDFSFFDRSSFLFLSTMLFRCPTGTPRPASWRR